MTRWPGAVYDEGEEPDPRFSLANERTFLAWLRTALALLAGGVAVRALDLPFEETHERAVGGLLVVLAVVTVAAAYVRWARTERAMRRREELPGAGVTALVATLGVAGVGVLALVWLV